MDCLLCVPHEKSSRPATQASDWVWQSGFSSYPTDAGLNRSDVKKTQKKVQAKRSNANCPCSDSTAGRLERRAWEGGNAMQTCTINLKKANTNPRYLCNWDCPRSSGGWLVAPNSGGSQERRLKIQ